MRPDEISAFTKVDSHQSRPVRRRLFSDNCEQKVIVEYINQTPSLPLQLVTDFDESSDSSIYCDVIVDNFKSDDDSEVSCDTDENSSDTIGFHVLTPEKPASPPPSANHKKCKDWDSINGSQETFSEFNGFHDYCVNFNKADENIEGIVMSRDISDEDGDDVENLDWLLDFSLDSVLNFRTKEKDIPCKAKSIENNRTPEPLAPQRNSSKPPYNYGELIQLALKENGQLTVDDIYNWIRLKFPYYRFQDDKRWKAGIRHKLSTHSAFVKTSKSATKRGHLWSYVVKESENNNDYVVTKNHWKKQKIADYRNDVKQEYARLAVKNALKNTIATKTPKTAVVKSQPSFHPTAPKTATPAPRTLVLDEQTMKQYVSNSGSKLLINGTHRTPSTVSQGQAEVTSDQRTVIHQTFSLLQVPGSPNRVCKLLNPKQNITYAYLLPNTAFLNPVSPGEVMKESGLMDDPPSTKNIMSLPSYTINVAETDASQELFDGALKVHQRSNTPTIS